MKWIKDDEREVINGFTANVHCEDGMEFSVDIDLLEATGILPGQTISDYQLAEIIIAEEDMRCMVEDTKSIMEQG